MIGTKILILKSGDSLKSSPLGLNPITMEFQNEVFSFEAGDVGVIKDVTAVGDKLIVESRGKYFHVPIDWIKCLD